MRLIQAARVTNEPIAEAEVLRGMKKALVVAALSLLSSGCTIIVSNAAASFSDNLSKAVLNQDDPELVRDGVPTLLLTMDSLIEGSPDSPQLLSQLLSAGATLYATYGAAFADDEIRASKLTSRARRYASRAMCETYKPSCDWPNATYDEFVATLDGIGKKNADVLYTYGFAWLAYLRAHSSDWDSEVNSSVYTYMGIMLTLRPPSLGGEPERAREFFEKAIADSGGADLSAKVEYARGYAKLLYERELHDRLLNEVMEADPNQTGFVLSNVMAQEEAATLLAEADDYF